jgi:C-terminal processing protease CtpA/Prc
MPSRPGCCLAWCFVAAPLVAQQLTTVERERLASAVWAEARYNFPAWDRVRADWDSGFAALLEIAAVRQSDFSYYRQLRRFVALLGDAHAAIVPPAGVAGRLARPPLALRSVDRRPFLVDYVTNDEMRIARPERLAEILAVQGVPVEQWIRDSVLPEVAAATVAAHWQVAVAHLLDGEKGSAVHLQLRLPGGEERGASVTRSIAVTDRWPLTPPPFEADTFPGGVVWVRLNSFADPDVGRAFDRAFPDFSAVRGLIIDLRSNDGAGGGRETGYAILARLLARPTVSSRWRTPQYRPAYRGQDMPDSTGSWFSVPPDTIVPRRDRPAFTGPMAVLASAWTAGVAEDLLIAVRNAGLGPIVGETSAGATGQIGEFRLYRDWRLRLTVTRDAFPDGTEIGGVGVAPDLSVEQKGSDFLAGKDAALERARAYIAERLAGRPN